MYNIPHIYSSVSIVAFPLSEYVKNLEKEVQELKAKLRKAQHDAKHAGKAVNAEADCGAALAAVGDNEVIRAHVEALNSTIGKRLLKK